MEPSPSDLDLVGRYGGIAKRLFSDLLTGNDCNIYLYRNCDQRLMDDFNRMTRSGKNFTVLIRVSSIYIPFYDCVSWIVHAVNPLQNILKRRPASSSPLMDISLSFKGFWPTILCWPDELV